MTYTVLFRNSLSEMLGFGRNANYDQVQISHDILASFPLATIPLLYFS